MTRKSKHHKTVKQKLVDKWQELVLVWLKVQKDPSFKLWMKLVMKMVLLLGEALLTKLSGKVWNLLEEIFDFENIRKFLGL